MCNSPLHNLLTALPKCEHHVHLEGTLSPSLLFALAAKNNIPLPPSAPTPESESFDPAFTSPSALSARYTTFSSLDDFLHYYYIGFRVLLSPSDFEALTYAYLSHAARSANLRHAEVFFDPQGHTARGVPLEHVITGFHAAAARAQSEFGITAELIPCLLRHFSVEAGTECFDSLISTGGFADGRLKGVGLCSTELDKPPEAWKGIFARAKGRGIRRTAHAGEEGPAGYVRAAVEMLDVMRVDHGVRAAEDNAVMQMLADKGVMLTVCPMSNVALKGARSIGEVPVRRFLDAGVRFSLNSDDPAYFGGYIQENYCAVEEAFGLSVEEWGGIARNAVEGSWCSEERKGVLLGEVEAVLGGWRG
ncbi:hypothetical protein B0T16DRAFT_463103 [Cercophora newfieldiana]|uniref:Adenine deaminase n=1 Tax=Cercophora newfieldiana TaxID=92897 RepID=A0AA40CHV7_9PEZI|nr:hypothetical protein B0T16DRAFT_463103 [Cercophora newfieldiana]